MHLDAPTIAFVGFLTSIGISTGFTLLLVVLRGQPVLRLWAASLWLVTLGALFLGLRDQIPDGLSILGGNGAIVLANALLLRGIASHVRHPCRWRVLLGAAAAYLASIAWYTLVQPDLHARIALFNLQCVASDGAAIALLLRRGQRDIRRSRRLAAVAFALDAAFYLARPLIPMPESGEDIMRASTLVSASYVAAILVTLATSFALLLLITERMMVDLRHMARIDGLTGLPNRGAILTEGARSLARCRWDGKPFALLLFDLDHFKQINDTWGHEAGDAALEHFAQVIRGGVKRPDAMLGRYGGEEFVLSLPGLRQDEAQLLAERLREALAREPALAGSRPIPLTTSIGVAAAGDGDTFAQLVAKADEALYRAKSGGRNQVVLATPLPA